MLRARIETALAVLFTLASIATAIWPTWIETLTRLEPDGGSGETEWQIVIALGAAALVAAVLARRDYRLARGRRGVV
jgi:hypothetical protein